MHAWHRTELLVGKNGMDRLYGATVMVIGIGGVGSYAVEALARACVGTIHLVDFDDVCVTNVNRQLHAMKGTFGKAKVEVMAERLKLVNTKIKIVPHKRFYSKDSSEELLSHKPDFILDCIDNMTAKMHLIKTCYDRKIPLLVTLGTAQKLNPLNIKLADLHDTDMCPMGKIVRQQARVLGIKRGIPCLYSDEVVRARDQDALDDFKCICYNKEEKDQIHSCDKRLTINGTISYLPSMFGMAGAGLIIQSILGDISIFNYCSEAKSPLKDFNEMKMGDFA